MTSTPQRTPVGLCAMCFTRKKLAHGWAWLKLCEDCASKHGAQNAAAARATPGSTASMPAAPSGVPAHSEDSRTDVPPAGPIDSGKP